VDEQVGDAVRAHGCGDAFPAAGAAGRLSMSAPSLRADRLLRVQGYTDPQRVRPAIRAAAERAAVLGADIARGEVAFRRLAVTGLSHGRLTLAGGHVFHCPAFQRFLAGCPGALVFVLTAGEAFDREVRRLMREDEPVLALFLDAAGWMAVESVTRRFVDWLRPRAAAEGLRLTRRLGPGYRYPAEERAERSAAAVEWPLAEQSVLFAALGEMDTLPVELLDSAAMRPGMSRSGLFGLRRAEVAGGGAGRRMG
jgi:hypothetical protein